MITVRNRGFPALIKPASAWRWPLETLHGLRPQYRANCLPERNRSKQPISARMVTAVIKPTEAALQKMDSPYSAG
jgi:hypothetical protein